MENLSLVIPCIKPDLQLLRLYSSIRFLSDEIEVVIVVPESAIGEVMMKYDHLRTIIVKESGIGIYSAMNDGLYMCSKDHVMFFGADDLLLSLPREINSLNIGDIYLYNVFWGQEGVYKNCKLKYRLMLMNWCHQGVIYRKDLLTSLGGFKIKYKYQADHYANILLAFNRQVNVVKINRILSWYSADGSSTYNSDKDFREDFPSIVKNNIGYIFSKMIKIKRYFRL